MNEQRLERALRQGPPFATRYVPAPPAFDARPVSHGTLSVGRLVLIIAVTALLLVGMLAGLAALGAFQDRLGGATYGWVAFTRDGDIYLVRDGVARDALGLGILTRRGPRGGAAPSIGGPFVPC